MYRDIYCHIININDINILHVQQEEINNYVLYMWKNIKKSFKWVVEDLMTWKYVFKIYNIEFKKTAYTIENMIPI